MTPAVRSLLLDDGSGLRSPLQLGNVAAWFDALDSASMIYDSSNRIALRCDKSGNSGTGSGTSTGLYLRTATGQYASAPDAAPLRITGDIDIRADLALATYASGAAQTFLVKGTGGGVSRAYQFVFNATGQLIFLWTDSGGSTLTSTWAAPGFSAGSRQRLRVTMDVDNGAGGSVVTFYTSTDGVNWTQGYQEVRGSTTSIYNTSAELRIGGLGSAEIPGGTIYSAQIYNGIGGTLVFNANFVGQRTNATSFTESSSNAATVTINGTALLGWVDPANCLVLNGTGGNYASASDSAALDITGDIDVRVDLAADNWASGGAQYFLSKWQITGTGSNAYIIGTTATGYLEFSWSTNGTTNTTQSLSTVVIPYAALNRGWLRATLDVDNGAGGYDVKFYTSPDGATWTQLGATVTGVGVTSIAVATSNIAISGFNSGGNGPFKGRVYRAQIYNGIGGTLVFDANFATCPKLASTFIESSSNAAVVTINTSGATGARVSGARDRYQGTVASQPIYLPWAGQNYGWCETNLNGFSTPLPSSMNRLSLDVAVWVDGRPSTTRQMAQVAGSFIFAMQADGALRTRFNSSAGSNAISTVAVSNTSQYVRFTYDGANVKFYTSPDATTWTQLGANVAEVITVNAFAAVMSLGVGGNMAVGWSGPIRRAIFRDSIDGTVVYDFDPSRYTSGSTFTAATGEVWTINSGALIVTRSCVYADGTDDYDKTFLFSYAQPCSVYVIGQHLTWTASDFIVDGGSASSLGLLQSNASPQFFLRASGVGALQNGDLPLQTTGLLAAVFNAAASQSRVNRKAPVTGDPGSTAANGFTFAARGDGAAGYGNVTESEIVLYSGGHDISTRDRFALYAGRKWRIPV